MMISSPLNSLPSFGILAGFSESLVAMLVELAASILPGASDLTDVGHNSH